MFRVTKLPKNMELIDGCQGCFGW